MPTETKSKTQPSQFDTKYFAGVVIVIAVLGMMGGYTIFPMLQSPKDLTLTANLTNNNSSNSTSPVAKHSITVKNDSVDTSNRNHTGTMNSKNTNKSVTTKQTRFTQTGNQNNNNNT